jgi:suppressor for copper-sensitivity B
MKMKFLCRLLFAFALLALVPGAWGQSKHSAADVSAMLSTVGVHPGDQATVAVEVDVHDGLHAQSHTPSDPSNIRFVGPPDKHDLAAWGDVQYPAGTDLTLAELGKLNVYLGKTIFRIPVTISADAKPGALKLAGKIFFQACNDKSCFPPETIKFSVDTTILPAAAPVVANALFPAQTTAAGPATAPAITQNTTVSDSVNKGGGGFFDLANAGAGVAFTAAFLIGLIFNLMPCVLPVLPLKIMGFYEVSQHNRAKSVALGAVFSTGLIASFGVLAVLVVGMKVLNWGGLFQHAWFTATISLVLVAMAISTFGFFTVNVPTAMYSFTPRHDTYTGNFLFGILTAALSTPCTFGMFVGLLTWSLNEPRWIGVSAIMMVGVGMAFPYFALSAIPEVARKFPHAGPWAEVVKQMMGFMLLATAVYFARPFFQHILSEHAFYWTLFAVLAGAGVFIVARGIQLSKNLVPRLVCCVIAILIVVPSFAAVRRLTIEPFKWTPYTPQALAAGRSAGTPVLIDFTASWCGNCHYLEAAVLHDSKVVENVHDKKVLMLQADVTDPGPATELLEKLNSSGAGSVPLTAVYFPNRADPVLLRGIYSVDDLDSTLDGGVK